jgi:hypothetical protein
MPMHTRGTVSSGTGPTASSELSPQVPVLLQEVTVPHSRIATSVLVWVDKSVLAVSMLRAGSTPSAGDGRGRGEGMGTGTGARADSISSAGGTGGTRSSGGLAQGRREVVGSARKRVSMPTRPVSLHTRSRPARLCPRSCLDSSYTSASAAVIALRPIIGESKGGAAEEQWILPSFYQFFMTIQSRVM